LNRREEQGFNRSADLRVLNPARAIGAQGRPGGDGAVGERVWCFTESAGDSASIEQEIAAARGCHPCLRADPRSF